MSSPPHRMARLSFTIYISNFHPDCYSLIFSYGFGLSFSNVSGLSASVFCGGDPAPGLCKVFLVLFILLAGFYMWRVHLSLDMRHFIFVSYPRDRLSFLSRSVCKSRVRY